MRYPCSTRSSSIGSAVRTPHAGARACPQRRSAPRAHAPRHLPCMRALAARRSPLAAHTLPSLLRLRTLVPVAPQPFTRPAPAAAVTVAKAVAEPYVTAEEREEQRAMGCAPPQLKPFGGRIQLIFCGDFLQLPPVQARHTPTRPHTSSHTRTPAHTRTHPRTPSHVLTHPRTPSHTLARPHTSTHPYTPSAAAARPSVQSSRDEAASLRDPPSGKQLDGVPYGLWECSAKPAFTSICWCEANLQPPRGPGCNPMWSRLQPPVVQAAVPCS